MPVVVSVPHSGSRTLLRHLQNTYVGPERETGPWHIYHFGEHDEDIAAYEGHADIPVRNPADVIASWLKRGKSLRDLFGAMERMVAYTQPHTVHRVEDLPLVIGHVKGGELHRQTLLRFLPRSLSRYYQAHGY